jgi:hypothetical protein
MGARIEPSCDGCYFRRAATMECHRHAPKVNELTGGAMWPKIDDGDNFCGDFEPFNYSTTE